MTPSEWLAAMTTWSSSAHSVLSRCFSLSRSVLTVMRVLYAFSWKIYPGNYVPKFYQYRHFGLFLDTYRCTTCRTFFGVFLSLSPPSHFVTFYYYTTRKIYSRTGAYPTNSAMADTCVLKKSSFVFCTECIMLYRMLADKWSSVCARVSACHMKLLM